MSNHINIYVMNSKVPCTYSVGTEEKEGKSAAFPKQSRVDGAEIMVKERPNHILLMHEIKASF